jgi:hypothetical protein
MNRRAQVFVGLLLLVALAACATTPIGKAVQSAHVQKQIVEASAVEFAKLHFQGKIPADKYAKGRDAYEKWAAGEVALAKSLADWKRIGDTESSQRLSKALQLSGELFRLWSEAVGGFVDLVKMKSQIEGGK